MKITTPCRRCGAQAAKGSYAWPANDGSGQWLWAKFCAEHGAEAVRKGARWMRWTPKTPGKGTPVVVPGVELEGMTAEEKDRALAKWLFSPPDELGPVARDLRQAGTRWWRLELRESMDVWRGAQESLGLSREQWGECAVDIASEAIEHAEALGL